MVSSSTLSLLLLSAAAASQQSLPLLLLSAAAAASQQSVAVGGPASFLIVDPVLTPYTSASAGGALNLSVVPAMAAAAAARGVDVVLLGGSNGEWPSLSTDERLTLNGLCDRLFAHAKLLRNQA